jgi:hypothetical protein
MIGARSRWTCDKCGETVAMTHKGHHRKYKCPGQGSLLRAKRSQEKASADDADREAERKRALEDAKPPPPRFYQYLACVCGCGAQIGQVKGNKTRQFVNSEHHEKWRKETLRAAGGDGQTVEQRKHAEEVAAVVAKDDAIRREAEAVLLLSREASYALWGACLGVAL